MMNSKIYVFVFLIQDVLASYQFVETMTSNTDAVAIKENTLLVECIFYCDTFNAFPVSKTNRNKFDVCTCVEQKYGSITSDLIGDTVEYEVHKPIDEINLSQGKRSWQSSCVYNYFSPRAFDGNLYQQGFSNEAKGCQHTNNKLDKEWIKVDLGKQSVINRVKIYNVISSLKSRLRNAQIEVASSLDMTQNYQLCAKFEKITTADQIESFNCAMSTFGRYVRLILGQRGYLHICEMQVMGFYY